jgi:hypothetical protein
MIMKAKTILMFIGVLFMATYGVAHAVTYTYTYTGPNYVATSIYWPNSSYTSQNVSFSFTSASPITSLAEITPLSWSISDGYESFNSQTANCSLIGLYIQTLSGSGAPGIADFTASDDNLSFNINGTSVSDYNILHEGGSGGWDESEIGVIGDYATAAWTNYLGDSGGAGWTVSNNPSNNSPVPEPCTMLLLGLGLIGLAGVRRKFKK